MVWGAPSEVKKGLNQSIDEFKSHWNLFWQVYKTNTILVSSMLKLAFQLNSIMEVELINALSITEET